MHRSFVRIAVAVLALSLGLTNVALADGPTIKKQYIKDAIHGPFIVPSGNPYDASDGDGSDGKATTTGSVPFGLTEFEDQLHNVQVNDPALDHVQTFTGTRPFEFSIQSETSVATFGKNVVVGYNSSANQPVVRIGNSLAFTHRFFSGYSASHDAGKTWTSGFVPPNAGSNFTFGDPSVGADRAGNFYYANLGATASGHGAVIVNKSTDGGATFAPAVVTAIDDGSDKEWLAVGRDPSNQKQDNLYVTWTSFGAAGSELRFVKSTDGGATWSAQRAIFAPVDNGIMSSFVQFSNPVVDPSNGRLYVPFLHFSNFDADAIRVLVSNDAGATFQLLPFNQPGAVDANAFMNVTPGELTDCGSPGGGLRNVLHQGPNLGGGRFGLARYRQSTRLITQPATRVANGHVFIAFNSSTSPFFGDPAAQSTINLLYSADAGASWSESTVAAASAADPQHVHPAITIDEDGAQAEVAYHVQQADGKLRVDLARGEVNGHAVQFKASNTAHVSSVAADLPPTNNPIPLVAPQRPFRTTNYDRTVQPCYAIGEYLSITKGDDGLATAWGDLRNSWTSAPGSPTTGTHSQPDVFFQRLDE
jgi:hypothetical protein